jgi:hypothetical protein
MTRMAVAAMCPCPRRLSPAAALQQFCDAAAAQLDNLMLLIGAHWMLFKPKPKWLSHFAVSVLTG